MNSATKPEQPREVTPTEKGADGFQVLRLQCIRLALEYPDHASIEFDAIEGDFPRSEDSPEIAELASKVDELKEGLSDLLLKIEKRGRGTR